MAALIMVRPERDWQSSNGLFDWTLEYLIPRLSDHKTAAQLREIVDENLGNLWIPDLPSEAQGEIYDVLRTGVVAAAAHELPPSAVDQLRELVALTY
jgi:hypothetical protein